MKKLFLAALAIWILQLCPAVELPDTLYVEHWDISNLEEIGGHRVTVFGDPVIVSTELGDAVAFDGVEDQLLVDFNPLMDAAEFTVELIFWPEASYPNYTEPRFLHIQDPEDPQQKRVMMELRIDQNNQCYLDGFMKTDLESLTLIDETRVHPTEVWHHAAITYRDSTLRTYFNGTEELSGTCRYTGALVNPVGRTSIGARMNQVAFFSGRIKTVRVTHACLEPSEFLSVQDMAVTPVSPADDGWEDDLLLRVYPSPVDRVLRLECRSDHGPGTIKIIEPNGRTVYSSRYGSSSEIPSALKTSSLADGLYTLIIESKRRVDRRRFLVLHQD